MISKIISTANFCSQGLGYDSIKEMSESLFHVSSIKNIFIAGASLGSVAALTEEYLGVSFIVYIFFMLLIIAEIWTGILASRKRGIKIQSRKGGRMIVKMGIYTLIIGGLYQLSLGIKAPEIPILSIEVNIWTWVYYISLNMIIFQLLISVLENLSDMGYKETSKIVSVLNRLLSKWFELKQEEK